MIVPEILNIKTLELVNGEGNGTPLQYSCLENIMDGGAWQAAVHGVAKSQTRLSDFTFTFHFHALEKEMATHSSVFSWRIPGTGEPGGLPPLGLHRVRHDWSDLAAAAELVKALGSHWSCLMSLLNEWITCLCRICCRYLSGQIWVVLSLFIYPGINGKNNNGNRIFYQMI